MMICKENGMIEVSGSPDEILREFASVFVRLFYLVNEETGVSLDSCLEKTLDIMEFYNQKLYAVLSKNNSGIKFCSDCSAWDVDREGCTLPSCDMDYACPLHHN